MDVVFTRIIVVFLTICFIGTTVANDNIIADLVTRIEALETERSKCVQQDDIIQSLRSEIHEMKQELADKEERIQIIETSIKPPVPSPDVQQSKTVIVEHANTTSDLQQRTLQSRSNVEKPSEERIRPERALLAGQPVGFHAVNSKPELHLGTKQELVFDTVLTNLGSGYHANHGTFIAPTHGLYMFSVSASSHGEAAHMVIATEMVKDGTVLARTYAKSDTGYVDQGSVSVVTELQTGNEVWVRLNHPLDTSLQDGSYSSFTGIMVYEFEG